MNQESQSLKERGVSFETQKLGSFAVGKSLDSEQYSGNRHS
jgi:hypothetical protein